MPTLAVTMCMISFAAAVFLYLFGHDDWQFWAFLALFNYITVVSE